MDWNRLERLLEEAMELPVERRSEFLHEACAEDPELRAEALSLVGHVEPSEDFFSALAAELGPPSDSISDSEPPDRIGPYKILALLGEGGMGRVWLAEQDQPVKRRVALKVIKLGMDTKEVVARFESERQALAVMDHPCIARVFDGGVTEEGRPYFVMEVVDGVPITDYCDVQRLGLSDRIQLFVHVCQAVQHAHLKGVIHRDLKPSNVLVTARDGDPAVKVIDFGVAKAVSGTLTETTLVTSMGQTIGTPAYMSPEQASGDGVDVDSRTDVYTLGIMLYELLIGALPFTSEEVRRPHTLLQLLRRDEDVPTPSARLSDLADTQQTVAQTRQTDVRTLRRELKGDLDWIVMKAIEKDRSRRYETVNGLAEDLERFLRHEPVVARPPTPIYRLQRFVRRNRAGIAAAAISAATLLVGAFGTSVGLVRAREAERAALEAQAATQREVERAEWIGTIFASTLVENFTTVFYLTERPIALDTPAMLRGQGFVEGRILRQLQDEPLLAAGAALMSGTIFSFLNDPERAMAALEEATELVRPELVGNRRATSPERSASYDPTAEWDVGLDEVINRALEIFEQVDGPASAWIGHARHIVAAHYLQEEQRFGAALRHYLEAIRIFETLEERPRSGYQTTAFKLRYDAVEQFGNHGRWAEVAAVISDAVASYSRRTRPPRGGARELVWFLERYLGALAELGRDDDARLAGELVAEVRTALERTPARWQFDIPPSLMPG